MSKVYQQILKPHCMFNVKALPISLSLILGISLVLGYLFINFFTSWNPSSGSEEVLYIFACMGIGFICIVGVWIWLEHYLHFVDTSEETFVFMVWLITSYVVGVFSWIPIIVYCKVCNITSFALAFTLGALFLGLYVVGFALSLVRFLKYCYNLKNKTDETKPLQPKIVRLNVGSFDV